MWWRPTPELATGRRRRPTRPRARPSRRARTARCSGPTRDGLMLIVFGAARGAPRCRRSCGSGRPRSRGRRRAPRGSAASRPVTSGSSIQASGNASSHHPVELRVGDHVHRRAAVEALEVERVHRARGRQLVHQLLGPGVGGVELEAGAGVALEQRAAAGPPSPAPRAPGGDSRIDTTKLSGRASRPSTSASERPAWRRARSSAADSNAQRR